MRAHLRAILLLLGLTLGTSSFLYPLAILIVGQTLFPVQANGNLVGADGQPARAGEAVGSRLIAQEFTGDEYFHPRPSAAAYDAAASAGSNWGASNPKLRDRASRLLQEGPPAPGEMIPADRVTASGSGLDPHITLRNARSQLDRVASAWASRTGADRSDLRPTIEANLQAHAFTPLVGLTGEPILNVLEVNLALRNILQPFPGK